MGLVLIIDGAIFIVVGAVLWWARRVALHYHRRMVSMSWEEISAMRRRQGPIRRAVTRIRPKQRRARLGPPLMLLGAALAAAGTLIRFVV